MKWVTKYSCKWRVAGVTLIELLIVVAIIGILGAVGVAGYSKYQNYARDTVVRSNFVFARDTVEMTFNECFSYGEAHTVVLDHGARVPCNASNDLNGVRIVLRELLKYLSAELAENPYDRSQPAIIISGQSTRLGGVRLDYGRASDQCDGSGRWCIYVGGQASRERFGDKLYWR